MKLNKKFTIITSVLLSALLVTGIIFPFATAKTELLPGQKELFVKTVSAPAVQDGIFNGHELDGETVSEYGINGPTNVLTPGDYRAVDLSGNPLDTTLPSYINLYMAKDADALYLGMEIPEDPHAGDLYEFTTFLGFGDSADADTMNSGIFTTYKMDNESSPNYDPGTWMDTQVTKLSARKVAADGTVTDTTASRKFSNPVEYTLPAWASETTMNGTSATFFEAELDFEDAMLGSGLDANATLPDYGYFAFEIGIFDGTTKIGNIVFNANLANDEKAPDGAIKTVPHLLNLDDEFDEATADNANLASLSIVNGTLSPAFNENTTEYTVNLPGVSRANVTATAVAANARVTVEGTENLTSINSDKTIKITVVSQKGTSKVYTVTVTSVFTTTEFYVDAAGNDETGNGSSAAPFATIEKALATAAAKEWNADEALTIHVNGTISATVSDGKLFGVNTIFTKGATRLPITIKGDSKTEDIINPPQASHAATNNYNFDTLTYAIDEATSSSKLFAGSGNVRFDNVNWTTADSYVRTNTVFYCDTTSAKVFAGWTAEHVAMAKSQNANGNIDASITLGKNANYDKDFWVVSVIADAGGWSGTSGIVVKSTDMEISFILDGSTIYKACIFNTSEAATTTYANANIIMYDGKINLIQSDTNSTSTETINASVHLAVYGGESYKNLTNKSGSYIRGSRATTINGDMKVTVESGSWWLVQGGMGNTVVAGDYEANIGGDAIIGDTATDNSGLHGYAGQNTADHAVRGTVTHNIYGNAYVSFFRMHGSLVHEKVTNNISGGTIHSFVGVGTGSSTVLGEVENNISGGTITTYYGASGSIKGISKVTNNISGGIITTFNGVGSGISGATLNNNISGGTITTFNGVATATTGISQVNNTVSGGTITTFNGVPKGASAPKVVNKLQGGTIATYYGAVGSTSSGEVTNVDIVENNIIDGTITGTYNGTYNANVKETHTNISGGEFKSVCYITYLHLDESDLVKNTITGGIFNSTCLMGGYGGKIGKVENHISGGTFQGNNHVYLGPGSTTWPSIVGEIENNITGGNFGVRVYGSGQSCNVTGNVVNNVLGGTFKEFYAGAYTGYYCYSTSTNSSTGKKSITCNMFDRANYKFTNTGTDKNGASYTYTDYRPEESAYFKKAIEGKIINTFGKEGTAGPTFNSPCFCADLGSTRAASTKTTVETTVYSGTWNSSFYGGGDTTNSSIASITNTFKGGIFNKGVWGASFNTAVETVTNNVEGGTFKGNFFAGSRRGNISGDVINNISGGTFNALFFGGSDQNSSKATVSTGTGAPTTYTIGGSIKNTFTGGTFKTGASGAGFGTIKGNVENTLKGNPNFQLGYYGVQATLMDTIVEGNVINLITKDENGVAPTFPKKNAAIDYSFENTDCTIVYCTDGTNIGFAATSASGTIYTDSTKAKKASEGDSNFTEVHGYVETTIEAGTFNGHYYAGGGVEVFGEKDGYAIINIVKGDPVFNYVWAGACISSNRAIAYKVYNEINSGTFNDDFSSFNRTATAGTKTNAMAVDTVIKGGTFNDVVELSKPWSAAHYNQHQRIAPYTITIEGGTFNGDVYGLSYWSAEEVGPFLLEGGDITININGGIFAKNIIATSNQYTVDKYADNAFATINIAPTKGDVTILGTVSSRFANEKVNLLGGEYKLILGADAEIVATEASGDVKIGQDGTWKKQTYVTLPEGNTANVTVTGTHCTDKIADSVVAVKGGVQLFGATMLLTDRVAVRALFDKASIEASDDFTFSFVMNGETLAEGSKADLEPYGDDYYCIMLSKIGANDFTDEVVFSGSDMVWDNTFSIKLLAVIAETAWAGNEKGVDLAKAMQNFATIVADPTATLPHTITPDLSKNGLDTFTASASRDDDVKFEVTGKGLIMSNAVGIRIYGTYATELTKNDLVIKVNGADVTDLAVISAGVEENEYYIDLYVHARSMSTALNIQITEKSTGKVALSLTDRVDAIATSYPETHEKYNVVQQLLVYIQAAVEYANQVA